MRGLIVLIVFVAIAVVGFNYFTTGTVSLIPGGGLTAEQRSVRDLRRDFTDAQRSYLQAGRAAGLSGVDSTGEAGAAIAEVERIHTEAKELRGTLTTDQAKSELDRLLADIRGFLDSAD